MAGFRDRVKDTTTTTGTGSITLSGTAATSFRAFADAFSVASEYIPYAIVAQSGGQWEVGYGVLTASTTLTREWVTDSSSAGAKVNFSAGTKDVFVTIPADWMKHTLSRGRIDMLRQGVFW